MKIKFSTLPQFDKKFKEYKKRFKSIGKDIRELSLELNENPTKGILVKNNSDNNRGKSGGYRVLYYYIAQNGEIIFMYLFYKGDLENISDNFIDELLNEIEK